MQRYLTITEDRYQDYVDFEEVNESLFQRIKQLYKSKAAKIFRICEFISYHPLHYSKYSEEDWDSVNKFNYIKTAKTKMDQDLNNLSNCLNYKTIDDFILNYPRCNFNVKKLLKLLN